MVRQLDEADVKQLQLYDDQYFSIIHRYGEVSYAQRVLAREQADLETKLQEIESNMNQFSKTLEQKYGSGTIDIENKTITTTA